MLDKKRRASVSCGCHNLTLLLGFRAALERLERRSHREVDHHLKRMSARCAEEFVERSGDLWIDFSAPWRFCISARSQNPTRKENSLSTQSTERLAYKVKTFARLSDLSERFVKQEIYDGNLKAVKKGAQWRIPAEAAREYWQLSKKEEAQNQVDTVEVAA